MTDTNVDMVDTVAGGNRGLDALKTDKPPFLAHNSIAPQRVVHALSVIVSTFEIFSSFSISILM